MIRIIKSKFGRILSFILIFCMTLILPMTAYAEDSTPKSLEDISGTETQVYDMDDGGQISDSTTIPDEEQSIFGTDLTGKYFIFSSFDKVKTSSISYKTIGYTISRCIIPDPNVTNTSSPDFAPAYYDKTTYITISLNDLKELETETFYDGNGNVTTTWKLEAKTILTNIKKLADKGFQDYKDWYDDLVEHMDDFSEYIMFNAVMTICDNGTPRGTLSWADGRLSCIASGDVYIGNNIELNGVTLTGSVKTQDALKYAESWANRSAIDTHFNKWYQFNKEKEPDDDDEPDEDPGDLDELVTYIGKKPTDVLTPNSPHAYEENANEYQGPYYKTYNYSNDFSLRDGIPTTEDIQNGIECDTWTGLIGIGKRSVTKTYDFTGKIKWTTSHRSAITGKRTTKTHTKDYSYSVTKTAYYYYIYDVQVYDFTKAVITNDCFRNDRIEYISNTVTDFNLIKDDELNPENVEDYSPDNDKHIKWTDVDLDLGTVDGSDKGDAKSKFKDKAKELLEEDYAYVKNDRIEINGNCYLEDDGKWISSPDDVSQWREVPLSDIPLEERTSYTTIPAEVANGDYPTTMEVLYTQNIFKNDTLYRKYSGDDIIKTRQPNNKDPHEVLYIDNEPIRVHTPVISPLTITNPEEKTQLVSSQINPDVSYQLLLDGTYNFHWDPAKHLEILGYGDSGDPSKYDKYVKTKQVRFPFDVYVGGRRYDADEWIDLKETLDEYENFEVYIPPYAIESSNHIIDFRVAPLNVMDEHGESHWDDEEYLANLNIEDYVATYHIPVQLSGRIYGFEIVSINDEDTYYSDADVTRTKYPIFNFVQYMEEKKAGNKNRVGGDKVRYTLDDSLRTGWDAGNVLPLSKGSSKAQPWGGEMICGHAFYYTLWTMANLWDFDDGDRIEISPSFRYVAPNGTQTKDVDIWYRDENDDWIKAGSAKDLAKQKAIAIDGDINRTAFKYCYRQEDAEFTAQMAAGHQNPYNSRPYNEPVYNTRMNAAGWLNTRTNSYSEGHITLHFTQKLLAGNETQLERNLDKVRTDSDFDKIETLQRSVHGDFYLQSNNQRRFRMSMQKWFGGYYIPNQIFICDKGLDVDRWAIEHGGLSTDSEIWKKYDANKGYLILNFYIESVNDGNPHLKYSANCIQYSEAANEENQWKKEGLRDTAKVGHSTEDHPDLTLPVIPGDIAIINPFKSINDYYKPGIFVIN